MYIRFILAVFKDFVLSYHVGIGSTLYLMTQLIALYYSEVAKNSHMGNSSKDIRMEWLEYALITVEIFLDHVEYLLSCWDLAPEVSILFIVFFGASERANVMLITWDHPDSCPRAQPSNLRRLSYKSATRDDVKWLENPVSASLSLGVWDDLSVGRFYSMQPPVTDFPLLSVS